MPFYLSFWLLFLQWLLYAVSQITTNNSNENLHFNEGFVRKNKHTATDYNAGSGYRRVLKKIIYFGPVQQPYKETDTNTKVLSWAGFAEVLVCVIFFHITQDAGIIIFPKALSFCYWECLWKFNSHHFRDHISTSAETVPLSMILWCYMDKEDKCERTEGNKRVTGSNHQKKKNWENTNPKCTICFSEGKVELKNANNGKGRLICSHAFPVT